MSEPREPLWAGRFATPPAADAEAVTRSISFDARLAPQDVRASIAHVRALQDAGLLAADEADMLEVALRAVGEELAAGRLVVDPVDEDVHSLIERAVTERLGELGARVHAGRSRNDLVVTDLRLWLLEARARIDDGLVRLAAALASRAGEHAETVMPGTTHGRPAQPVTLGHHLLAHAWALLRDRERLGEWAARTSVSPLGAGALATSTLGLDAARTADRLGFARAFTNSLDAVSDRDFAQEFLAVAMICGTHLSRLAADLIRWSDPSVGWATLDEGYSTGSSMMPQKRNPDVAELARAKAGRLLGDLTAVSMALAGLPLGYHRDLQEDKEPLFDAADALEAILPAVAGCVETVHFEAEAMRRALDEPSLYATDVAEALVLSGVPFRSAHRRVGELLRRLELEDRTLSDLSAEEWAGLGLPDGASLLDPERSVRARTMRGGPSPDAVREQAEAIGLALRARGDR